MSDNPILCENLSHVYPGEVSALEGVSLEVSTGEVLGIVGQNGSGKTTLVKHFNGLLKPTHGRVLVHGLDSRQHSVQTLSQHVGYVFQNPNHQLFASTVEGELAFGPKNLGLSPEEIEDRVRRAAEVFDLGALLDSHPYRLGFPFRKLVTMASIYAMQPSVIVLDEPTTGQDHRGAERVRHLVGLLRDEGRTVVIVSHDMALIAEVADRIVAVWSAAILAVGSPREIFADDDVMHRTKLQPPQITQLSQRCALEDSGSLVLSVPEAVTSLVGRAQYES